MRLDNPSISGSISYLGGGTNTISGIDAKITGSFTGSFIGEVSGTSSVATTASYIELSNVDGSASLASRITSNSSSISSLETVSGSYANSASFASDISVNSASIASLETVSGSYANSASFASDISTNSASIASLEIVSGSYANSSSFASDISSNSASIGSLNAVSSSYLLNTTDTLTGDLTVTGNIIATTLNVQDVTASIVYSSGSNIFGSSSIDTQQFTGSILTSGSIEVNGDKFTVSGATGDATFAGDVVINNNKFYKAENASGTNYKIAGITNGNEIQIGAIDYTTAGTIFAGGDNISITTGGASGTTRMSIDSSGNSTFAGQVSVGNYAIPSDHQFQIAHLGQSYARFALTNSQTGNGSSDGLIFQMENLNSIIKNQENGTLGFGTNSRETDIQINSLGDVGIGGNASNKLHIQQTKSGTSAENFDLLRFNLTGTGAIGDSSNIVWYSTSGTKTAGISGISGQDNILYGELAFNVRKYTTDSFDEAMRINNRGNVGIGTDSPSTKLHLGGTAPGDSIIRQDSTASGTNWEIGERAAGKWQIFEDDADSIVATFMSSGNVGIGTTNPAQNFVVADATNGNGVELVPGATATIQTYNRGTSSYNNLNIDTARTQIRSIDYTSFHNGSGFTERMRITSGGNVAIGNQVGSAKLQVHSTNAGSASVAAFLVNASISLNTETRLAFTAHTNDDIATNRYSYISTINTSGSNGQAMIFATNETGASAVERMRITSGGQVNMTKGSSGTVLYLDGVNAYDAETGIELSAGRAKISGFLNTTGGTPGSSLRFYTMPDNGSVTERMRITSGGDIEIPTNSAKIKLRSSGSSAYTSIFRDSSNVLQVANSASTNILSIDNGGDVAILSTASFRFNGIGDNTHAVGYDSTIDGSFLRGQNGMRFLTGTGGGTERMRITSGGRVLIGPNSSSYSSNDAITHLTGNSSNYVAYFHAEAIYAGAWRYARFLSSGNSTLAGEINGSTATSVIYGTTSDYRQKKNIKPLENGLERLSKLKPVKFDWKENDSSAEGFIAHEVQEIFPDAIYGVKDGEKPQGMDYGRITPLLVKAIQELKADNDSLKARIETLENN